MKGEFVEKRCNQLLRIFQCCKIQHKQNSLKTSSSWRFCKCTVQTATNINENPFTVFQLLYTVGLESLHDHGALWRMYFSTTVHKRVSDGKIFNFHCSNLHTYTLHICANSNTKTDFTIFLSNIVKVKFLTFLHCTSLASLKNFRQFSNELTAKNCFHEIFA